MRGRFFKDWNRVRSSFWFLPAGMAGVAVALALVGVTVDEPLTEWLALNLGWTFTGGAEGASAVLGIIAGSMITIAGVVFSMTLVALSLARLSWDPVCCAISCAIPAHRSSSARSSPPSCTACSSSARSAARRRSRSSRICRSA